MIVVVEYSKTHYPLPSSEPEIKAHTRSHTHTHAHTRHLNSFLLSSFLIIVDIYDEVRTNPAWLALELFQKFTFILLNLALFITQGPDQTETVCLILKKGRKMIGFSWKQGCSFIKPKGDNYNISRQHINTEIQITLRTSRKA